MPQVAGRRPRTHRQDVHVQVMWNALFADLSPLENAFMIVVGAFAVYQGFHATREYQPHDSPLMKMGLSFTATAGTLTAGGVMILLRRLIWYALGL